MKVGQQFTVLDGRQKDGTKFLHLNLAVPYRSLAKRRTLNLYESAAMNDLCNLAIVMMEPRVSLDLIEDKPFSAMLSLWPVSDTIFG
jgi:hypothetical protein